jgi:hypothetical protein
MGLARIRSGAWRGVLMTLAVLAVALRIAVPQGVMVSAPSQSGVQLVICTGAGPLKLAPHAPADTPRHEGACAFAAHGATAPPAPAPQVEAASYARFVQPAPAVHADLAPGRGLAAPPPPSLGPPLTA